MWQTKDSRLISKFNVIVKNLPKEITSKDLSEKFKNAGEVFSAKIPVNSKSNSEGFGFVCFMEESSVQKAIDLYNGEVIEGKTLSVERYDKKSGESKEVPFNNL